MIYYCTAFDVIFPIESTGLTRFKDLFYLTEEKAKIK